MNISDLSQELIEKLARKSEDPKLLKQIALTNKDDLVVGLYLAKNKFVTPKILAILGDSKSQPVRGMISSNPKTPKKTLTKLSQEEDNLVVGGVAINPNTPVGVLETILIREDILEYVRHDVITNSSFPVSKLLAIVEKEDKRLMSIVAKNENLPTNLFRSLFKKDTMEINRSLSNNSKTPKKILIGLVGRSGVKNEVIFSRLKLEDVPKKFKREYLDVYTFKQKNVRKIKGRFGNNDLYLLYLKSLKEGQLTWNMVKKLSYGQTNVILEFKKHVKGKPFIDEDILSFNKLRLKKKKTKKETESWIKRNTKIAKTVFKSKVQRIFKKTSHVMQLNIPNKKFKEFLKIALLSEKDAEILRQKGSNHPVSKKNPTLGWVRYTILSPKEVWVDELQSDLWKIIDDEEFLRSIKNLNNILLQKFVQVAHKLLGAEKIYYPSIEIKRNVYNADPPISVYKDVPKKARFKKTTIGEEKPSIPPYIEEELKPSHNIWVLSAKEQKLLDRLCRETGLKLNINHPVIKACIKSMDKSHG